jgi:WS/DGAT/MGAT family acyltransferase
LAPYNYDWLSAEDNSFLLMETPCTPMHVASTQIFEIGPLRRKNGGVDFDAIKRRTASVLHRIPRYRQTLRWIPFENTPVWVDDEHFEIDYHLRHTSLPRPGSDDQLKKLSSRVMSQQLDRTRPLWEIWVVEGLEGDRFALISKIHHCMIDGVAGADISQILQSPTPDREIQEAPTYIPRTAPSDRDLFRDSVLRTLSLPLRALRSFEEFRRETKDVREEIRARVEAIRKTLGMQMHQASSSPINGELSPHKVFDWLSMPLEDVKAVRRALGCTVNDVVLVIVTGALREFMLQRQVRPEELDFRVQTPVSVRQEGERGKLGNRVSTWTLSLPIAEPDPLEQLAAISPVTQQLKSSRQALGVELMLSAMEEMPTALLSAAMQAAMGSMNTFVTNVPGPQFPLYMLGAEMHCLYPQAPLLPGIGLATAVMSYNGQMCWGLNADPKLVPDLHTYVQMLQASFERLAAAAGVELGRADAAVTEAKPAAPTPPKRAAKKPTAAKPKAPPQPVTPA